MSRRAVSEHAKADRRAVILDTAAELFERIGFRDISMSLVADRAGLAKGTLYLYFPTKEAIFLGLYETAMTRWFASVTSGLDEQPDDDITRIAGLLVDRIDSQPQLPALASLLHTVLERNIPFEETMKFKRALLLELTALGRRLEDKLSFLDRGDGLRLLLRLHALMLGAWQAATPAPIAQKVLEQAGMDELRIDFSEELENMLVLLLEGWRHREEA